MTRISMTFATAALTLSLAPAAHAYATAQDAIDTNNATLTQIAGTCSLDVTPILAVALNLPADVKAPETTTVACNG